MGALKNIKEKLFGLGKISYEQQLAGVIRKLEQTPIYFDNHDFRGGKYIDIAELVWHPSVPREKLQKEDEENRMVGNDFIRREKMDRIDSLLNPLLAKIAKNIKQEKDLNKAEELVKMHGKVRGVKSDYESRVQCWHRLGEQIVKSEYYGTPMDGVFENNLIHLRFLEKKYSAYNYNLGWQALEKAEKKIEQSIKVHAGRTYNSLQDYKQGIAQERSTKNAEKIIIPKEREGR